MTTTDIGREFKEIVLNKGSRPDHHDYLIKELRLVWPLMYKLIKRVEAESVRNRHTKEGK